MKRRGVKVFPRAATVGSVIASKFRARIQRDWGAAGKARAL